MQKLLDFEPGLADERKMGQKITLFISYACFLGAILSVVFSIYFGMESTITPIFASLLAFIIFFTSVGILLYVLGTGNLPSLKIAKCPDQKIEANDKAI
ncbi:MAG: hemerythrin family protein [Pseudomonadota bacterium]